MSDPHKQIKSLSESKHNQKRRVWTECLSSCNPAALVQEGGSSIPESLGEWGMLGQNKHTVYTLTEDWSELWWTSDFLFKSSISAGRYELIWLSRPTRMSIHSALKTRYPQSNPSHVWHASLRDHLTSSSVGKHTHTYTRTKTKCSIQSSLS